MGNKRSTHAKRANTTVRTRTVRPGEGGRRRRDNASSRRCGPCTACCSALGIEELGKPEWTTCAHLQDSVECRSVSGIQSRVPIRLSDEHIRKHGGGGCSIYRDRPASCSGFRCQWVAGMPLTTEEHRPDRCGLIIVDTADPKAVQVRELWPGAATARTGRELITSLRRAQLEVIVIAPGEERTLTPLTLFGAPDPRCW